MAKRKSTSYMSPGEQIAGVVFFVIYLVVLPFATDPLFRALEKLLAVNISGTVQNMIYYYVLFAVTVIIFHKFLMRTSRQFAASGSPTLKNRLKERQTTSQLDSASKIKPRHS